MHACCLSCSLKWWWLRVYYVAGLEIKIRRSLHSLSGYNNYNTRTIRLFINFQFYIVCVQLWCFTRVCCSIASYLCALQQQAHYQEHTLRVLLSRVLLILYYASGIKLCRLTKVNWMDCSMHFKRYNQWLSPFLLHGIQPAYYWKCWIMNYNLSINACCSLWHVDIVSWTANWIDWVCHNRLLIRCSSLVLN